MKRRSPIFAIVCFCLMSLLEFSASGQKGTGINENWVTTWATAQDLAPSTQDQPILAPGVKRPDFSGRPRRNPPYIPKSVADQTVRMIVHTSIGGRSVRLELSNAFGKEILVIDEAHVAVRKSDSSIEASTDRPVTFGGDKGITIRPGALIVSDPVDLDLKPMSDLAVSLYVVKSEGVPTSHVLGLHTSYIANGDVVAQQVLDSPTTATSYFWLRSVDVSTPKDNFAIVCLGDSITDGAATTVDHNSAWSALLAERLNKQKRGPAIAVLNEGINGNQVLRDGAGVSALARFDRDVLSLSGVRWIILLEGINDINIHGEITGPDALTAPDLIEGYRQIISRAHMHGIRVMGATLTPDEGIWTYAPVGEATRQAVNQWIRTAKEFDAIVDFDAAIQDKSAPTKLLPSFNSGDNIHPNDLGNQAMADSVPVNYFLSK